MKQIKISHPFYSVEDEFGVKTQSGMEWYSCRMDFADEVPKIRRFFYCNTYIKNHNHTRNCTAYINKIQSVMKLRKKDRCKITRTNIKNIIAIKLSDFWRSKTRRSLLTILIRQGHGYKPKLKNWKVTLRQGRYLRDHPRALYAAERFIKGYTKINLKKDDLNLKDGAWLGWMDHFYLYTKDDINEILTKPKKK